MRPFTAATHLARGRTLYSVGLGPLALAPCASDPLLLLRCVNTDGHG